MKSIVVYSSLSGHTKQYAEWISEELGSDCVSVESASGEKLSQYDVVIFGSHVRFGDITHRKRFAELSKNLKKSLCSSQEELRQSLTLYCRRFSRRFIKASLSLLQSPNSIFRED